MVHAQPRCGRSCAGQKFTQIVPVSDCISADLDFDGLNYQSRTWPGGTSSHPQPLAMIGPFSRSAPYPAIQFETDVGGYERLCRIPSGKNCQAPPLGARFYPYWMLDDLARIGRTHPARHHIQPFDANAAIWYATMAPASEDWSLLLSVHRVSDKLAGMWMCVWPTADHAASRGHHEVRCRTRAPSRPGP